MRPGPYPQRLVSICPRFSLKYALELNDSESMSSESSSGEGVGNLLWEVGIIWARLAITTVQETLGCVLNPSHRVFRKITY